MFYKPPKVVWRKGEPGRVHARVGSRQGAPSEESAIGQAYIKESFLGPIEKGKGRKRGSDKERIGEKRGREKKGLLFCALIETP